MAIFLISLSLTLLTISSVSALAINDMPFKRVLVTGGNKGIGKAICARLLADHPDVYIILGSRNVERGDSAVQELKASLPNIEGRIEAMELDTTSDESVRNASTKLSQSGNKLYGVINNAGIIGKSYEDTLDVNYFGPRRVNDAFLPYLTKPGGRIVNIASASGPMFVASCGVPNIKQKLASPTNFKEGVRELDDLAKSYFGMMDYNNDSYGFSKALLNAYTVLHAKEEPDLIINSCTPGFIDTDLTRNAGLGATNAPEKGTTAPIYCLMSPELTTLPTGRYYGSDAVRSPLDRYRGPGDPPYNDE